MSEHVGSQIRKSNVEKLLQLVAFVEDKRRCRRVQLLEVPLLPLVDVKRILTKEHQYFGEAFTPEQCQSNCDNCLSDVEYEDLDMTKEAKDVINAGITSLTQLRYLLLILHHLSQCERWGVGVR